MQLSDSAAPVAEEVQARSELDARVRDFGRKVGAAWRALEQAKLDNCHGDINEADDWQGADQEVVSGAAAKRSSVVASAAVVSGAVVSTSSAGSIERGLRAELKQVHPGLDLDWLPETSQFAIRACGARELYPLIDLLCEQLNQDLETVRPLESPEPARQRGYLVPLLPTLGHAAALERASTTLGRDFSRSKVRVGFVRGHLLEIGFAVPGCSGHQDAEALEAANSYAEAALGERVLDEWVGSVGVSPAPRGGSLRVLDSRPREGHRREDGETAPLAELSVLVSRGIEALRLGLPTEALLKEQAEDWTLLDSTPIMLPDGRISAAHMDDVLMAATRCPELLKCYLEGLPVSSKRFSNVGELFVYLKLPCSAPLPERPALRQAVEVQLEAALGDAAVLVGNAVGAQHIYVVLALPDLQLVLRRLLPLSPELRDVIPHGSTLQFLDATWQLEWLRLD